MLWVLAMVLLLAGQGSLEKQSETQLSEAEQAMTAARGAYTAGKWDEAQQQLSRVKTGVESALKSLEDSGAAPRRSKYYKRAELRVRGLVRRVHGFREEVPLQDRDVIAAVENRLQEIHDKLLLDIMSKRK